jgi:hypothetical protein
VRILRQRTYLKQQTTSIVQRLRVGMQHCFEALAHVPCWMLVRTEILATGHSSNSPRSPSLGAGHPNCLRSIHVAIL